MAKRLHIGDFHLGIADDFHENGARVFVDHPAESFGIGDVAKPDFHSECFQGIDEKRIGVPEEVFRGNHVAPAVCYRKKQVADGCHPRIERRYAIGTGDGFDAVLEILHRGIGDAGIYVLGGYSAKRGFHLRRRAELIGQRMVNGHR